MILFVSSLYLNPRSSASICGFIFFSTISSCLRQIIINHPAPIFLSLRCGGVAALFVAANLVLRIKSFKRELASRDRLCFVRAFEVEGDERGLYQFGNDL